MCCVGVVVVVVVVVVVLNSSSSTSTYKMTNILMCHWPISNIIFIAHEYSFIGCKFSSNRSHKKAHSNLKSIKMPMILELK